MRFHGSTSITLSVAILCCVITGCSFSRSNPDQATVLSNQHTNDTISVDGSTGSKVTDSPTSTPALPAVVDPLDRANERITKKPFGIKVSPGHSPVSPERFSGYHTGVDFETFTSEAELPVAVHAICNGKVIYKQRVSGYGGVLITSCNLNSEAITVLYGHIQLTSALLKVGASVKAGDFLADLGKGNSTETDGERKHLHLAIHKGTSIILRGYVQNIQDLDAWIDFSKLRIQ